MADVEEDGAGPTLGARTFSCWILKGRKDVDMALGGAH